MGFAVLRHRRRRQAEEARAPPKSAEDRRKLPRGPPRVPAHWTGLTNIRGRAAFSAAPRRCSPSGGALLGMGAPIEGKASMISTCPAGAKRWDAVASVPTCGCPNNRRMVPPVPRIVTRHGGRSSVAFRGRRKVVAASKGPTATLCEPGPTSASSTNHVSSTRRFHPQPAISISSQTARVNSVTGRPRCAKESSFFDFTRPAEMLARGDQHRPPTIMMMGYGLSEGSASALGGGNRAGDRKSTGRFSVKMKQGRRSG